MPRTLHAAAMAALALAAGCAVGPDYAPPAPAVPEQFALAGAGGTDAAGVAVSDWWASYGDPALNALIARAAAANLDLREAEARLRAARAQRRAAAAGFWPQLGGSGRYTRTRTADIYDGDSPAAAGAAQSAQGVDDGADPNAAAAAGAGGTGSAAAGGFENTFDLFQVGFDASWEIDVFGGTRRAVQAATADLEAQEAARNAVRLTVLAEVARNYIELRIAQERARIARENLALQTDTVGLTRARFDAGLTSELDVQRAEAQRSATEAQTPVFETLVRQRMHALALLMGEPPAALVDELGGPAGLPAQPPDVPIGLPSELLRRRPDVQQAERELAAASARIGEAVAGLFPKFSLTGSFGARSTMFDALDNAPAKFWSIGPAVSWPIWQAGRLLANVEAANAQEQAAAARYDRAVLSSLRDTEDALVAYANEQLRRQSLDAAAAANRTAVAIAQERYTTGLDDFLPVLDAERQLYASEDALVASRGQVLLNVLGLYKALGGGWDAAVAAPPETETAPEPVENAP